MLKKTCYDVNKLMVFHCQNEKKTYRQGTHWRYLVINLHGDFILRIYQEIFEMYEPNNVPAFYRVRWLVRGIWHIILISPKCRIYALVNWVSIGPDNGLAPVRRQAITWTNAHLLSIGPLGTHGGHGKWRPSCLGLNVSKHMTQPPGNANFQIAPVPFILYSPTFIHAIVARIENRFVTSWRCVN